MNVRRRKLDAEAIRFKTTMARDYATEVEEAVDAYRGDAERAAREARGECKTCFYLRRSRFGGAAMTDWSCGLCAVTSMHRNTSVPTVCLSCAKEHQLCSYCGGDVNTDTHRTTFPTPAPANEPSA
jgi:hypothetical protein